MIVCWLRELLKYTTILHNIVGFLLFLYLFMEQNFLKKTRHDEQYYMI